MAWTLAGIYVEVCARAGAWAAAGKDGLEARVGPRAQEDLGSGPGTGAEGGTCGAGKGVRSCWASEGGLKGAPSHRRRCRRSTSSSQARDSDLVMAPASPQVPGQHTLSSSPPPLPFPPPSQPPPQARLLPHLPSSSRPKSQRVRKILELGPSAHRLV